MNVDEKEVRETLKRVAELASVERLQVSMQECRQVTGAEPTDWDLEFWHAGYKHGALALIDAVREAAEAAWGEGESAGMRNSRLMADGSEDGFVDNPYRKVAGA